ncbi:MAG: hypothetical protein ACXWC6_00440 [Ramlibacter sp.]
MAASTAPLRLLMPVALAVLQASAFAQAAAARAPGTAASAPVDRREPGCEQRWRDYDRSAACFARFRTVHGVKAEAADRCGPPLKEPVDCPRR